MGRKKADVEADLRERLLRSLRASARNIAATSKRARAAGVTDEQIARALDVDQSAYLREVA